MKLNRVILYPLMRLALSFSLCLNICLSAMAQTINLQVVSKEITKEMKYSEGQILSVQGEKSEVNIMTWDNNYIHIELKLTAQHPERSIAEKDLDKFVFAFDNKADTVFINNHIIEKEETLRSGLQAYYEIKIPQSCRVKLENYFGTAELTDLSQGVDINSEFCNLKLKNVLGTVNVDTYFGDLIGVMIDGKVDIKANRSNVTLSEIAGTYNIDAYQGVIKVFANESLLDGMNINAIKSDVFYYDSDLNGYKFDLTYQNGNVELPDHLVANYTKEDKINRINVTPQAELIGVHVAINVISGDIMLGSR